MSERAYRRSEWAASGWDGPAELLVRRRRQMLVHSCLYYRMNATLVDDHVWQAWANELVDLQRQHGTVHGFYDQEFADWDASTGYHLPADADVQNAALRLLNCEEDFHVHD